MTVPELTLIQLSDTHIGADGELMHGLVDTFALLRRAIETVLTAGVPVHGLLLSGDLADSGKPEAYRRLRSVVDPAARLLDAEVVYVMGNHDERSAFAAELLSTSDYGPLDSVHWIGGLRVIALDSTSPGRHEGILDRAQLAWLSTELANPAPRGTLLVVHHPPLPSPAPAPHLLRLTEIDELAAVLKGTDVRMILSGHAHHTGCGQLAGIPVWVSPAMAYRVDTLPPKGLLRAHAGAGFTRIDLIDGTLVATAIELSDTPTVYERDRDTTVQRITEALSRDR
ncbi:metallophosphoesterase [Amycolatopsis sp. GM8]|uniref:metallophosphoesterase n=1 Tax=Amycolatopsis sp. GM8 TaxID=2896530 RepID=UPI001F18DC2A|nr:metallophosphoesterase [Amycolatopsis sp. GM8]